MNVNSNHLYKFKSVSTFRRKDTNADNNWDVIIDNFFLHSFKHSGYDISQSRYPFGVCEMIEMLWRFFKKRFICQK